MCSVWPEVGEPARLCLFNLDFRGSRLHVLWHTISTRLQIVQVMGVSTERHWVQWSSLTCSVAFVQYCKELLNFTCVGPWNHCMQFCSLRIPFHCCGIPFNNFSGGRLGHFIADCTQHYVKCVNNNTQLKFRLFLSTMKQGHLLGCTILYQVRDYLKIRTLLLNSYFYLQFDFHPPTLRYSEETSQPELWKEFGVPNG